MAGDPRGVTHSRLEAAETVEALYTAFSDAPRPSHIHCSPLYDNADRELLTSLLHSSVRELGSERLGPYAGWAMTTAGSIEDYQYFLPRIYELALNEAGWLGFEPWLLASKLKYADWQVWDQAKQDALRLYFTLGLEIDAAKHPDMGIGFESWLVANLTIGETCSALVKLAKWISPFYTALNFSFIISLGQNDLLKKGSLRTGIWGEIPPHASQDLVAFFRSSELKDLIFAASAEANEDDTFQILEPALTVIEQL